MKALTLAVVLLSSAASLAQTAPRTEGPVNAAAAAAAELRRPPPPGHSTPRPPQPMPPQPPMRNQAVVDREVMERRIDKLEKALRDAMTRTRDNQGRASIRAAMEELDKLSEYVDDAAPYGTGLPPPPGNYPGPQHPMPLPVVRPIADSQFRSLTQAMARETFARDKMRVLGQVAQREHFLVTHVLTVINQFSFSNDKLEVVRVMRPTLLDTNNSYELFQAFPFSSDKQKLQEILDGR
ncbi:DUF4476 domain-containing protein [Corallococcus sp. ZKHCc1 1396]|uniref:DUF4476 domain-containing protein n=1 Tax=Corallococcus soli TaxID=2710757 RepID=A0ABR9PKA8_9BACT|nr:DUF4476 domain-containing protein [Corallococcus soli]MBE4748354.1 DUF4476 domain-containing protein [Corallococcus soli]